MFSQDFELFQSAPTHPPASPRRAPSLDSTLRRSFNHANTAFQVNGYTAIPNNQTTRPPVPLFHTNSTGHPTAVQNQSQPQDITAFAMGGAGNMIAHADLSTTHLTFPSEINVAYDGTFGDLGAGGDSELFNFADESFDFELMPTNSYSSLESANPGTVSPKDLYNDSVPPSTTFTNLTTPGSTFLDTPADDYEVSPMFDSMTADTDNQWFSLFPDQVDAPPAPPARMERTSSSQILVHPGGEGNPRKRSSTQTSPTFSPAIKHSEVAGVGARKRDKPLPPIVVDEADPVALKRARNTAAARKSRAKKVMEKDDLEGQISDLKTQVEFWKAKALALGATEE